MNNIENTLFILLALSVVAYLFIQWKPIPENDRRRGYQPILAKNILVIIKIFLVLVFVVVVYA